MNTVFKPDDIRAFLVRAAARVADLFRQWDQDRSGSVEKKEFLAALRPLFPNEDKATFSGLFDLFDADRSGTITIDELYKHLRAGANVDLSQRQVKDKLGNMLDLNLKAGAAGEIQMPAERKIAHKQRRKRGAALHGSERLVANVDGSGPSVRDQLYAILKKNAMRVIDLFRDWDEDGNGMITFSEFRRAISTLGYEAEEADVRKVFDEFDVEGKHQIGYSAFNKLLRRQSAMLNPALLPGAIVVREAKLARQAAEDHLNAAKAALDDPDPLAKLRRANIGPLVPPPPPQARPLPRPASATASAEAASAVAQATASAATALATASVATASAATGSPRSFQRAAMLFGQHFAATGAIVRPSAGLLTGMSYGTRPSSAVRHRPRNTPPPQGGWELPAELPVEPVMDAVRRHAAAKAHERHAVNAAKAGHGGGDYWSAQRVDERAAAKARKVHAEGLSLRVAALTDTVIQQQMQIAQLQEAAAEEELSTPSASAAGENVEELDDREHVAATEEVPQVALIYRARASIAPAADGTYRVTLGVVSFGGGGGGAAAPAMAVSPPPPPSPKNTAALPPPIIVDLAQLPPRPMTARSPTRPVSARPQDRGPVPHPPRAPRPMSARPGGASSRPGSQPGPSVIPALAAALASASATPRSTVVERIENSPLNAMPASMRRRRPKPVPRPRQPSPSKVLELVDDSAAAAAAAAAMRDTSPYTERFAYQPRAMTSFCASSFPLMAAADVPGPPAVAPWDQRVAPRAVAFQIAALRPQPEEGDVFGEPSADDGGEMDEGDEDEVRRGAQVGFASSVPRADSRQGRRDSAHPKARPYAPGVATTSLRVAALADSVYQQQLEIAEVTGVEPPEPPSVGFELDDEGAPTEAGDASLGVRLDRVPSAGDQAHPLAVKLSKKSKGRPRVSAQNSKAEGLSLRVAALTDTVIQQQMQIAELQEEYEEEGSTDDEEGFGFRYRAQATIVPAADGTARVRLGVFSLAAMPWSLGAEDDDEAPPPPPASPPPLEPEAAADEAASVETLVANLGFVPRAQASIVPAADGAARVVLGVVFSVPSI